MRNWDDWSDRDVNMRVARVLHPSAQLKEVMRTNEVVVQERLRMAVVDYCNNWSDMGPLIVDNKICIEPKADAFTSETNSWIASDFNIENLAVNANPLRAAAAIVFLMMVATIAICVYEANRLCDGGE